MKLKIKKTLFYEQKNSVTTSKIQNNVKFTQIY